MTMWKNRLSQWEARLRSVIEGNAARLFTSKGLRSELALHLVAAMQSGRRAQPGGETIVPNLYTVMVSPGGIPGLRDDAMVAEELAVSLQHAAHQAGYSFLSPPVIRFIEDTQAAPNLLSVTGKISIDTLADTTDLVVEMPSESVALPRNAFLVINGERLQALTLAIINIGRRPDNNLVIDDQRVSRVHAQLRAANGHYLLFDLDSRGGTFVNGQRITQTMLYPGDVISLAGIPLVYGEDEAWSGETQQFNPSKE